MKHNYLIFILFLGLSATALAGNTITSVNEVTDNQTAKPLPLTAVDFALQVGSELLIPGEEWSDNPHLQKWHKNMVKKGITKAESTHVGEMWYGNDNSKYYSVETFYYKFGVQIFISNMNYDRPPERDGSFIIKQITVYSPAYATNRHIAVGMSKNEVIKAYGKGGKSYENTDGYSLEYRTGKNDLTFFFKNGKVEYFLIELEPWYISSKQ